MEDAKLYAASNALQKRDALVILNNYIPRMRFTPNDTVLDFGSGSGDVTRNILFPLCPHFDTMVGVDISEEMVHFANDQYSNTNLAFHHLDLLTAVQPRQMFPDGFDKIFSLYCLHWVKDYRRILDNFYTLLRPGGQCLLVFLARNPIFDVYETIAANKRWAQYMQDVTKFVPVYQKTTNPEEEFQQLLEKCGFVVHECVAPEFTFTFQNLNYLKNAVKAVNPFINRIPEHLHKDYLNETLLELQKQAPEKNGSSPQITARYHLLIAFAEK